MDNFNSLGRARWRRSPSPGEAQPPRRQQQLAGDSPQLIIKLAQQLARPVDGSNWAAAAATTPQTGPKREEEQVNGMRNLRAANSIGLSVEWRQKGSHLIYLFCFACFCFSRRKIHKWRASAFSLFSFRAQKSYFLLILLLFARTPNSGRALSPFARLHFLSLSLLSTVGQRKKTLSLALSFSSFGPLLAANFWAQLIDLANFN